MSEFKYTPDTGEGLFASERARLKESLLKDAEKLRNDSQKDATMMDALLYGATSLAEIGIAGAGTMVIGGAGAGLAVASGVVSPGEAIQPFGILSVASFITAGLGSLGLEASKRFAETLNQPIIGPEGIPIKVSTTVGPALANVYDALASKL